MVKDCYKQTYSIISKHREAMDKLVDLLIEKETLDGEEFVKILSEFTPIPEKERSPQILS
jgi:cell division protease FtsH